MRRPDDVALWGEGRRLSLGGSWGSLPEALGAEPASVGIGAIEIDDPPHAPAARRCYDAGPITTGQSRHASHY